MHEQGDGSSLTCSQLSRVVLKLQDDHGNVLHHGNMERAVKVLERMENQNTFKELAMDFKVHAIPSYPHTQDNAVVTLGNVHMLSCAHSVLCTFCSWT